MSRNEFSALNKYLECSTQIQLINKTDFQFTNPLYTVVLMEDDNVPGEDHCDRHTFRNGHIQRISMFNGCETLAFHNCHFTCSGGDCTRSNVYNVYLDLSQSLPLPVSTPPIATMPRPRPLAHAPAKLLCTFCLIIAYYVLGF
ncbi:hypothetical protein BKA70DRAFT_1443445 [Coprinopsis sp. MPI-PUGE-AT-0042]|nr:hypothetical protein BKA70DRAFT_1443445 [Coprinopsis sp. MPI-PUGE-AT-0042]